MIRKRIDSRRSFIQQLNEFDIELDQRIYRAIEMQPFDYLTDSEILFALYKLNSIITRHLIIKEEHAHWWQLKPRPIERIRLSGVPGSKKVFERAVELVGTGKTLSVYHFIKAVVDVSFATAEIPYYDRPYSVQMLLKAFGEYKYTPLSESTKVKNLLEALNRSLDGAEDFQFIMSLDDDRLVFRVTSVLEDYVQLSDSGMYIPQRAILTHFKDQFGGFTQDEIEELEELINSPTTREKDFQKFCEKYPHFFRRWDYRDGYPHVYLDTNTHQLIPDFILTDVRLQKAAIVELKLAKPQIIRRQLNRDRFAAAVMEARAQLMRYRNWFRDTNNRRTLKKLVGMEIYEPHLAVIIGRTSEFRDEYDRQTLLSDMKDIEIVTYDDILAFAERRRMIIQMEGQR